MKSLALESAIKRSFGKAVYFVAAKRPAEQLAFSSAK